MKKVLCICFVLIGLPTSYFSFAYSNAACDNANELSEQDIIVYKTSCREYNLDTLITRQEVAAIALKIGETCGTIGYIPPYGDYRCENIFADVSATYPNRWACRAVETLAEQDIISQNNVNRYGEPLFYPLKNITRSESLAMILDGAGGEFQDTDYENENFSRTGFASWQKPLLQYAYDNGIISSINSFGPNTSALRHEVFAYAIEAIQLCENEYEYENGDYSYDDEYLFNDEYSGDCGMRKYTVGNNCYNCGMLPPNANYTNQGSCDWQCNNGYYKSGNICIYNGGYEYQYGNCISGQYYSNGTCYSCGTLPYNAYYSSSGSCDWQCNSGYTKSGNSCVGNTPTCSTGQYLSGNTCYSCGTLPYNAYYSSSGSCDWTCNSGYYKSGGSCVANITCSTGQYASGGICTTCTSKPSNSYYTTAGSCDWACNSGYSTSGNTCVRSSYFCEKGEYYSGASCYSCGSVPTNGYYTTEGSCDWSCNSGYYKSGGICVSTTPSCSTGQYVSGGSCYSCGTAPTNGYYTTAGSCDWSCNSGYYKSGGICVAVTPSCSTGQYLSGNTCYSCTNRPTNAYYTTVGSCDWTCNSGYYVSGSQCVIAATSCTVGQFLSSGICYNCSSKPSNSHYTTSGTCAWTCDSGYTLSGSSCIAQQPAWSVSCGWSGWYTSTTHGGSYPTGGKGNTMSFYCNAGKITAVSWNKGSGSVNTSSTSGVTCNFSGSQAIDPQDFHGGSDEYIIVCDGTYLTGILARTNNWASGGTPTSGGQPTCTTSLSTWSNGIGYTCSGGKVTAISKP